MLSGKSACGQPVAIKFYRAASLDLQCIIGSAVSPGHVSPKLFLGMLQPKIGFLHDKLPARKSLSKEPKFV